MTSNRDLFSRLSQLSDISSVSIANEGQCSVTKDGSVQASSHLPLDKVLYVSNFPINLLSISAITKTLFYFVTFYAYHCIFQNLQTWKRIGLSRKAGKGLYLLVWDEIPKRLLCSMSKVESSFL